MGSRNPCRRRLHRYRPPPLAHTEDRRRDRNPQDSEIYRRLVEATLAWRVRTRPTIDGLEHAGDVPDAETVAVAVQHVMTDLRRRAAQPELE